MKSLDNGRQNFTPGGDEDGSWRNNNSNNAIPVSLLSAFMQIAGMAEENSRHALEVAQRLSQQLQDAKGRIRDQEADVRYFQDRAERSTNGWLKSPQRFSNIC